MGTTMEPDMQTPRRHYTPEQKVNILREHLIERTPVSDLCDRHGIAPTLFYQWQKPFLKREPPPLKAGGPPLVVLGKPSVNWQPSKASWPCATKPSPSSWKSMCV